MQSKSYNVLETILVCKYIHAFNVCSFQMHVSLCSLVSLHWAELQCPCWGLCSMPGKFDLLFQVELSQERHCADVSAI